METAKVQTVEGKVAELDRKLVDNEESHKKNIMVVMNGFGESLK